MRSVEIRHWDLLAFHSMDTKLLKRRFGAASEFDFCSFATDLAVPFSCVSRF